MQSSVLSENINVELITYFIEMESKVKQITCALCQGLIAQVSSEFQSVSFTFTPPNQLEVLFTFFDLKEDTIDQMDEATGYFEEFLVDKMNIDYRYNLYKDNNKTLNNLVLLAH